MALEGGEGSAPRPGRSLPPGKTGTIVQEAGWDPGPFWTGEKNLDPIGIRSPDRPARSQSLYRLNYPANGIVTYHIYIPVTYGEYSNSVIGTLFTQSTPDFCPCGL
jgi:hypothetical protein